MRNTDSFTENNLTDILEKFTSDQAGKTFQYNGRLSYTEGNNQKDVLLDITIKCLQPGEGYIVTFNPQEMEIPIFSVEEKSKLENLAVEQTFLAKLISTLSHEMNTPLGAVMSYLRQSLERLDIDPDIKAQYLKPALASAKLLAHFVADFIDFILISRDRLKQNIEVAKIEKVVMYCISLLQPQATRKGISLKYNI